MNIKRKQSDGVIQDTKKLIIDTARQFFSEYSYLGVSMSDIAKKLNISKAALYYHFTSKDEVYEKVLSEVFYDLSLTISQALKETTVDKKLYKLIKNYLDFGLKEKNLIKAVMLKMSPIDGQITKYVIELRRQIANLIQPVIDDILQTKKITKKVDSQLLTSMLTNMMDGLLLEYSFLNKKIDSVKISEQIITVLF